VLQLINVIDSNNEAGDVQGKLLHEENLIEKKLIATNFLGLEFLLHVVFFELWAM